MLPSLEYIAGFLDGDGHIGISKSQPKKSAPQHYARVTFYSQSLVLLQEIQTVFGAEGHIRAITAKQRSRYGISGCYRLYLSPTQAVPAVESLLPYLRLKKEQGQLVLDLAKSIRDNPVRGRGKSGARNRTKPEVLAYREALFLRCKELNHELSREFSKIWVNSVETPEGATPSRSVKGSGFTEGVTATGVSPNNTPRQERPSVETDVRHSLSSTILQ